MSEKNYSTSFLVDQSPKEVFNAINNVRGWWSEGIDGCTDELGALFYYHFKDIHRCTLKITEFLPNKKVVWRVLQNYFLFVEEKTEWTGTDIVFEIARKGDKTAVQFTHIGLVPEYECYTVCSDGWNTYINKSLHGLIATGSGYPNVGGAITDSERTLSK